MPDATASESSLDEILLARAIVARFGERDALSWWDDEALMPSGAFVMGRLFPRTAVYAQAEVAIEAATLRHQAVVPQPARITLFRLPPLLESAVRQRMLSVKRDGDTHPLGSQIKDIDVSRPINEVLIEAGAVNIAVCDAVWAASVTGNAVSLGTVHTVQLEADDEVRVVVQQLAAGYALGSRGTLIVPFYETSP